ncbi:Transcriptional regulator, GntR family with LacI sensor [uncultured spirochete]|jgi:DNA-binding LacI/PurR family transcriptional regulator|uniref:Transcriptional regulator, GntR family with LacI sensor n=1 Tax=uncultured spirochete TaxID=156406 RepID=A0A3P3XRB3_9SPIR|nr:Transcriptional regulator, GntR family with LacI sensor [uncultured spirochete]
MSYKKYEMVTRGILGKIESGEWSPGTQILAERKLAELFSVSRITVQKALDDLVERNILERPAGRNGTFVRSDPMVSQRTTARKESRLVGVAIDDISDSFGAHILRGIEDCLWNRRYHTIICNVDRNFRKVEDYFFSLSEQNIDGVIFSPVIESEAYEEKNRSIIERIERQETPLVLLDRTIADTRKNFVSTNHREASRRLTADFIARGNHRRLILVTGVSCSSIAEREEGFLDAVRAAGLDPGEQHIVRLNDNLLFPELQPNSPYIEEIRRAIGDVDGATGFVALNGRLLRGASLALCGMGFPLGRFTRSDLHGQFAVPLDGTGDTLVSVQPAYQLGYEAARLLLHSIETPGSATMQIRLDADITLFGE